MSRRSRCRPDEAVPVFGSATVETSGMTRPGHDAFAVTPGPFCHAGRAKMFEHQLPPPLQVVDVLYVAALLVEYVLVPPTADTYGLSDGKPDS